MKIKILLLLTGLGFSFLAMAQKKEALSTEYDSILAAELGADEYGMRRYVMAFLKSGPNRSENKEEAAKLQRAHLDNITRMAEEGKLLVAGPFLDGGEIRGIYIFAVESVEEAEELTKTDPAIKAGTLVMDRSAPLVWECGFDQVE